MKTVVVLVVILTALGAGYFLWGERTRSKEASGRTGAAATQTGTHEGASSTATSERSAPRPYRRLSAAGASEPLPSGADDGSASDTSGDRAVPELPPPGPGVLPEVSPEMALEMIGASMKEAMRAPIAAIDATEEERRLAVENLERFDREVEELSEQTMKELWSPKRSLEAFEELDRQRIARDKEIFGAERADQLEALRDARLAEIGEQALLPFPIERITPEKPDWIDGDDQ